MTSVVAVLVLWRFQSVHCGLFNCRLGCLILLLLLLHLSFLLNRLRIHIPFLTYLLPVLLLLYRKQLILMVASFPIRCHFPVILRARVSFLCGCIRCYVDACKFWCFERPWLPQLFVQFQHFGVVQSLVHFGGRGLSLLRRVILEVDCPFVHCYKKILYAKNLSTNGRCLMVSHFLKLGPSLAFFCHPIRHLNFHRTLQLLDGRLPLSASAGLSCMETFNGWPYIYLLAIFLLPRQIHYIKARCSWGELQGYRSFAFRCLWSVHTFLESSWNIVLAGTRLGALVRQS